MKLKLHKKRELQEIEVNISYKEMSPRLSKMIKYIQQYEYVIDALSKEKILYIPLYQILYFDTVDRKTFLYTSNQVYMCKKTLVALENDLSDTTVVRINKGTLLNITSLMSVKPYPNHRLLAELSNGEHLIISRKYIPILQNILRRGYYV